MRKRLSLFLCLCFLTGIISLGGCQSASKKPLNPAKKPSQTQSSTTPMTASERRVMANKLSRVAEGVPGVQRASVVVMEINMTNNTPGTTTTGTTNTPTTRTTTPGVTNNTTNRVPTPNNTTGTSSSGIVAMVGLTLNPTANGTNPTTTTTPGNTTGTMNKRTNTMNPTNTATNTTNMNAIKKMVADRIKTSDKRVTQVLVTTDPNLIKRINDVAAGIIEGKPIKSFDRDVKDLNNRLKREKTVY